MSEEIGLIYINTSRLLDDICVFLRDDITKEAFSAELKKKAETLIKRSKIQLQQISVITNGECYMEMEEQKQVEEEEEEELIYMDAEEEKEIPMENNFVCPFAGLPAKDLPLGDKYGYISLKTKFIFGFEKLKRLFAAIQDDWFLMYCNEKDSKPCYTYCLRVYKARIIATNKQTENETLLFGLVNLETEHILQFIAQTHKDMLQWIARINRYHTKDHRQLYKIEDTPKLETVPAEDMQVHEEDDEEEEHYDMVIVKENDTKNEEPLEEDEIYEVIRPQSPHVSQHIPIPKPSDISTMPTKRKLTPLPPLPLEKTTSSDSLASYDNPVAIKPWHEPIDVSDTNSFSEEDDQEIYDVLATIPSPEQDSRPGKASVYPLESPKEELVSPTISSIKEKLLQSAPEILPRNERPPPPKKLVLNKSTSSSMFNSTPKENKPSEKLLNSTSPVKLPMGNEFPSSSPNDSPTSTNGRGTFAKRSAPPKPSLLTKPRIDVKIIKSSPNSKSTTKQVMKLAKEISLK